MSQEQSQKPFEQARRYIVLKITDLESANIGLLTYATLNHICHAVDADYPLNFAFEVGWNMARMTIPNSEG